MKVYLKSLWKVLLHKWYVFLECCKLGVPLLGILHDWTKLLPCEFFPYARWFCGRQIEVDATLYLSNPQKGHVIWYNYLAGGPEVAGPGVTLYVRRRDDDTLYCSPMAHRRAFDRARNHHQKANRHHWQYWVMVRDRPELRGAVILPMPDRYRKEMLADLRSVYGVYDTPPRKPAAEYYLEHRDEMLLHPETRAWIEEQLGVDQ